MVKINPELNARNQEWLDFILSKDFVEECHLNNIGVIVDWVPGHFTINDDALAYYDGTPTFEYQDHNKAHNYGWGALNFDLGKNEVQSFLISSIKFWIDSR